MNDYPDLAPQKVDMNGHLPSSLPLHEAVDLLRALPRQSVNADSAADFRGWRDRHRMPDAQLVAHRPPQAPTVDYDLLLPDPDGGVVALTWQPDGNQPWLVDHSAHRAGSLLVTVNGQSLAVIDALPALRVSGQRSGGVLRQIVEQSIELDASKHENAVDSTARIAAFRRRFRAEQAWAQVAATPQRFVLTDAWWVRLPCGGAFRPGGLLDNVTEDLLARVAWRRVLCRCDNLPLDSAVELVRTRRLRADLPSFLTDAQTSRTVVVERDDLSIAAGVLAAAPSPRTDDPQVLRTAGEAAYAEWLDAEVERADVQWHWS